MDRYQKVEKPKLESPINENEIRITSQGLVRNYISYATSLLQERHDKEIVLKAMGQAISKTVAIAEIIKRRVPRLHQDTAISSVSITDVWEPIEEGLLPVEQTRHVSMISISLSTKELNKNAPGYQAPSEQARQYNYQQQIQPPRQARVYNAGNEDSYGRGRGRGRGRGWSRGGYANYQENGGYSNWDQNGGRGGGYGGGRGGSYGGRRGGGYDGVRSGGYDGVRGGGYDGVRGGGYGGGRGGGYNGSHGGDYDGGRGSDYDGGRGGGGYGGYRGAGYGRGRGGGGRGYGGRGRGGRMAPAPKDGGNQA